MWYGGYAMESFDKTVKPDVIRSNGTEYPVIITRVIGRNIYDTSEGQVEADEYQEIDWGPKLGVTRMYGHKKKAEPEETAVHRKSIEQLVGRLRRE